MRHRHRDAGTDEGSSQRKTLMMDNLKFRVLDEADEMLNMGFVDDVELILKSSGDVQTLLFYW